LYAVVPAIARERAIDLFSARGRSVLAKLSRQPAAPARTELLYLPYYRFAIELSGSTKEPLVTIAIDGLIGEGVFFLTDEFEVAPVGDEQRCEFSLSGVAAQEIALDQYKRLLLEHGLRNKSMTTVQTVPDAEQMFYPFWIGYVRQGDAYDFKALDAVSGDIQGVRMRRVFLAAFRQLESH